jgi:hypothetical protein
MTMNCFNPYSEAMKSEISTGANVVESLEDVIQWIDSAECPHETSTRETYKRAIRKAAKLRKKRIEDVPASSEAFLSHFQNKDYQKAWGKTFCAAKRWKRNVTAAINGANGTIAARKERRARKDGWKTLLDLLKQMLRRKVALPCNLHEKELISVSSTADIARHLDINPSELDADLALLLYRSVNRKGAKDAIVFTMELLDGLRELFDEKLNAVLPEKALHFTRPVRATVIKLPVAITNELDVWVEVASRGEWSITDCKYTGGTDPKPYFHAVKKVIATAVHAGAIELENLSTIASVFNKKAMVIVVQTLKKWRDEDTCGSITPRTATGYLERLIPFLERNGEDADTIRSILKTDEWINTSAHGKEEMNPKTKDFCRNVVTDKNYQISFLALHIRLRAPLCQGCCPLLYFSLIFRWAD